MIRFALWSLLAALLTAGQIAWMYLLRGPRIEQHDRILIGGQLIFGAAILLVAWLLKTTPSDAIKLRRRTSEILIVAGAVVLNLAAIILLRPAMSEDLLRYRFDGRMWLSGTSPYATPPNQWAGKDGIDAMAPFGELPTIYPPASQAIFVALAAIEARTGPSRASNDAEAARTSPWRAHLASPWHVYTAAVFRAAFAALAVICTLVLLALMRLHGASPWWAVLLAWNPLLIFETGGMGHQDVAGVLLMLLALLLLSRKRSIGCGACVALAAAIKPFGLLLMPFVLRYAPGGRARMLAAFLIVSAALYVPALAIQHGYAGWRETARTLSAKWEFNGSMHESIKAMFGSGDEGRAMARAKQMSRLLAAAILLVIFGAAWQLRASPATAGYALCLAALLVSPVAYPWYALWPLGFVPVMRASGGRGGWTALVWSATAGISYVVWHQPTWQLPRIAMLAEYVPVYFALAGELFAALALARNLTAPADPHPSAACPHT